MIEPKQSINPPDDANAFYADVLEVLNDSQVNYMVAGSFASYTYTGRVPDTKDLDVFLCPEEVDDALEALKDAGYETELTYGYWIAKAWRGNSFVDLIFRAASGLWEVEPEWLARAVPVTMWGVDTQVVAPEELIWSKAGLMDRERYDGNNVLHLLQAEATELDWPRLLELAGDDWPLLLSHLTLFGYVYPDLASLIPKDLIARLALRLVNQQAADSPFNQGASNGTPLCRGTLISNKQYLEDVEEMGYADARIAPWGRLSREQLAPWVQAVKRGDT